MFRGKKPVEEDVTANVNEDVALALLVKPPARTENQFFNWHNDAIYEVQCYLYGKALASVGAQRTDLLLLRAELEPLKITVENVGGATDEPLDFDASDQEGEENQ